MAGIAEIKRPDMKRIAKEILDLLTARAANGQPEEALDKYIPEAQALVAALETGVGGKTAAAAALKALLVKLDEADVDVDTWLRHICGFIQVEANRRSGPNVAAAQALEEAAFPDGLAHVDDYIPDESSFCRQSMAALRQPDQAPTVAAIGLPAAWIDAWEASVDTSEAAWKEVEAARGGKSTHALLGQDAEVAFADLMRRLKSYVDSRAPRTETAKVAEGKALIQPLLTQLANMRAAEKARATKKKKGTADKAPPAPAPAPVAPAPDAPAPAGGDGA